MSTGDTALGIYFLRDRLALNPRMHVGYLLPLPWRKLWLLPSHAFQLLYVFFQYNFFNPDAAEPIPGGDTKCSDAMDGFLVVKPSILVPLLPRTP